MKLPRPDVDTLLSPMRRRLFHYFWTVFALLLILSTRRLWLSTGDFPQVPFLAGMLMIPAGLDLLFLGMAFPALCLMLLMTDDMLVWRICRNFFVGGMLLLFLSNQHRLQPWAWQFVLIALASLLFSSRQVAYWWRWLAISLYFFSALSKFDLSFADELGLLFLKTVGRQLHFDVTRWPLIWQRIAALSFPSWELATAILLCFPQTRIIGLIFAWIMHAMLLLILGPWGLNHHAAVLIWNLFFICQAGLLFWPCRYQGPACPLQLSSEPTSLTKVSPLPSLIFTIILVLPILEILGLYDHWPAWGLYSSRIERVKLWIAQEDRSRLPLHIQSHLAEISTESDWLLLKLDRWSLEALHAPIYPQGRFLIGVSAAVLDRFELHDKFRIQIDSEAGRFTKTRDRTELRTWDELQAQIRTYRLNAQPRLTRSTPQL